VKVAVTCIQLIRDIEQHRAALEGAGYEVVVPSIPGQHLEGDALVDAVAGCVGVVAGDDRFSRSVLERLPELRVISKWGIGVDGIDHDAARDHAVVVRNTPGMFDDEVADVTMAYLVGLARSLFQIDRGIRAGGWPKPAGTSLAGSTLAIVGLGGIGRAVGRRALAAGMRVVGSDPSEASAAAARADGIAVLPFVEAIADAAFMSVNCPLTPDTFHLLGADAFAAMRPGVRVVNTGRGAVIDTTALVGAIESGRVAAAALDVLEEEPPGPDHPLRRFEQVVFGSHNASNTLEASARTHVRAVQNLLDELARLGDR
jgi:D-3-phosphoglycerate dehydrogenase